MVEHAILGHFACNYTDLQLSHAVGKAFPNMAVHWEVKRTVHPSMDKHFLYFKEEDYTLLVLQLGHSGISSYYIGHLLEKYNKDMDKEELDLEVLGRIINQLERTQ